jgi:mRNA interferase HigB
MRIFTGGTLAQWIQEHPTATAALSVWRHAAEQATWKTPNELLAGWVCDIIKVKAQAKIPQGLTRVVFDISGNRFRLMCHIHFARQFVFLKWFGTQAQYDRIDFTTLKVEDKP